MARIYSERFLVRGGPAVGDPFIVPAGHRAVIRSVIFTNSGGAAGSAFLRVAGSHVMWSALPAAVIVQCFDVRIPVYEGETIHAGVSSGACLATVSGFLFDDTGASSFSASPELADEQEVQLPQKRC